MAVKTTRVRLSNCIRKNSFRYYVDSHFAEIFWKKIVERFGQSQKMGGFDVHQIANTKLIIRYTPNRFLFSITILKVEPELLSSFEKMLEFKGE